VESAASGAKLLELERAAFGVDHCELSLSLLKKWNLPQEMVDAAAHHHDSHAQSKSTGLVHIACLVADHLGFSMSPGSCGPAPDLPPLARQTLEDEPLRVEIFRKVESLELGQQGWPSSCI
jgi:HD-like signal output (HDOD) protein